ncbi:MAG TPA: 30S ribosomal protein S13 [Candidatus Nanoarchaeia archaeon]|nr:30S ribosomal protein S13 [Candidatus Nanoarchaeia archaeon]
MAEQKAEKEIKYLVRIASTDLDGKKPIGNALLKIKGIGFMMAHAACTVANVSANQRAGQLSDKDVQKLDDFVKNPLKYNIPAWMFNRRKDVETGEDKHLILSDLQFANENDIKMMKKIKCYRGVRHIFGLPVRGQSTKSNFRKNKGKALGVKKPKMGGKT